MRTEDLPAGEDIGDSHELLMSLCDKMPWLDKLLRFEFGTRIQCKNCPANRIVRDSMLEFPVAPAESRRSLSSAIQEAVRPFESTQWTCEDCKKQGCTQQHLLGATPEVLVFHRKNLDRPIDYPSVLVLNKQKFALFAVTCYNGAHWWTLGRDLPPGKPWHTFDDTRVTKHDPNHFPIADTMRLLFYART